VKLRAAPFLATPLMFAVVVTVATAFSASPIELNAAPRTVPNAANAAPRAWRVKLVSTADLEGPPVVVPGTNEGFALHGSNGEEVSTEPLERVNLVSGDVSGGPRVPDDALLAVVGARVVLIAPARFGADGIATRPWTIWTVDPSTLRLERPVVLPFVSNFGVVVPLVDPAPDRLDLWVGDGGSLRLIDLADGKVRRLVKIPALNVSVDPTGNRLYVLTGTGGSTRSGTSYRADTIVELNDRTGAIVTTTDEWTASPRMQISASVEGVYLLDTGTQHPVVLLDSQSLRPVDLPAPFESTLAKTFQRGQEVTIAPVAHGVVVSSTGRLTCISHGAASIRASTTFATSSISSSVFARQGGTLFVWNAPPIQESSRIEAIAIPSVC
jgi:hypothetical protein